MPIAYNPCTVSVISSAMNATPVGEGPSSATQQPSRSHRSGRGQNRHGTVAIGTSADASVGRSKRKQPQPVKLKQRELPSDSRAADLAELLKKDAIDCLICVSTVQRTAPIWTCRVCFAILHLSCAKQWVAQCPAVGAAGETETADTRRRGRGSRRGGAAHRSPEQASASAGCPACSSPITVESLRYTCFCEKVKFSERSKDAAAAAAAAAAATLQTASEPLDSPPPEASSAPGSAEPQTAAPDAADTAALPHACRGQCGKICSTVHTPEDSAASVQPSQRGGAPSVKGRSGRPLNQGPHRSPDLAPHRCALGCHPGPCPPCTAVVEYSCYCGDVVTSRECRLGPPSREALAAGTAGKPLRGSPRGEAASGVPARRGRGKTPRARAVGSAQRLFSCGGVCNRELSALSGSNAGSGGDPSAVASCTHRCAELCHVGSCPPCTAVVADTLCHCGKHRRVELCGGSSRIVAASESAAATVDSSTGSSCPAPPSTQSAVDRIEARKVLVADGSTSGGPEGVEDITKSDNTAVAGKCAKSVSSGPRWRCDTVCGEQLPCGHACVSPCHPPGQHPTCSRHPTVATCACGAKKESHLPPIFARKSCRDPPASCGSVCGHRKGPCGHACKKVCGHDGWQCEDCPSTSSIVHRCRCGGALQKISCSSLREVATAAGLAVGTWGAPDAAVRLPPDTSVLAVIARLGVSVRCSRICGKGLSCRRHTCREECCLASEHICIATCNKPMKCGHTCPSHCHAGACPPCPEIYREPLFCGCGRTSAPPPVVCGTPVPQCGAPCPKQGGAGAILPCGHAATGHVCHPGECPPCVSLCVIRCGCGRTNREQRCSDPPPVCSSVCGALPSCCIEDHRCKRTCHVDACVVGAAVTPTAENVPETSVAAGPKSRHTSILPCGKKCMLTMSCSHACPVACHAPHSCDASVCNMKVEVKCRCGFLVKKDVPCSTRQALARKAEKKGWNGPAVPCTSECERNYRVQGLASGLALPHDGPNADKSSRFSNVPLKGSSKGVTVLYSEGRKSRFETPPSSLQLAFDSALAKQKAERKAASAAANANQAVKMEDSCPKDSPDGRVGEHSGIGPSELAKPALRSDVASHEEEHDPSSLEEVLAQLYTSSKQLHAVLHYIYEHRWSHAPEEEDPSTPCEDTTDTNPTTSDSKRTARVLPLFTRRGYAQRVDDMRNEFEIHSGSVIGASYETRVHLVDASRGAPVIVEGIDLFSVGRRRDRVGSGPHILRHANLRLLPGHTYALLGDNGVGKSTLAAACSSGMLKGWPREPFRTIHCLAERSGALCDMWSAAELTPLDVVCASIDHDIFLCGLYNGTETDSYQTMRNRFVAELQKWKQEHQNLILQTVSSAVSLLNGFGVSKERMNAPVGELSGGYLVRVMICAAFLATPDVLFLDEVSAHLDFSSRCLLVELLSGVFTSESKGSVDAAAEAGGVVRGRGVFPADVIVVVADHDMTVLDAVCTDVIVFEDLQLHQHPGDIASYQHSLSLQKAAHTAAYLKQESQARNLVSVIAKARAAAAAATTDKAAAAARGIVRSRKHALDMHGRPRMATGKKWQLSYHGKREQLRPDATHRRTPFKLHTAVSLLGAAGGGAAKEAAASMTGSPFPAEQPAVFLDEVVLGYADVPVLRVQALKIGGRSRVTLIGPNGSGKTTLLHAIAAAAGLRVPRPPQLLGGTLTAERVAMVTQCKTELLEECGDKTLTEILQERWPSVFPTVTSARQHLGGLGLSGDAAVTPIAALNAGLATRASLALALAASPAVLLLDEMTSNLDDASAVEVVNGLCEQFEGALVFATHDPRVASSVGGEAYLVTGGRLVPQEPSALLQCMMVEC